ncbi:MAG: hypothetical protein ACRBDI_05935 [Alphaproteobacteria bacterium]
MTKIYTAHELFEQAIQAHTPDKPNNHEFSALMRKSAIKGHGEAQYTMGIISYAKLQFTEAAEWFGMVVNNSSCEYAANNKSEAQKFLDVCSKPEV